MALRKEPITVFGDGLQTRDFVYISDVVDAYLCAAGLMGASRSETGRIFNVGTGLGTSILTLAKTIADLTAAGDSVRFLPERPGDIRHSVASIEAIETTLHWEPKVMLEEGLIETLGWLRDGNIC
jgi:UDP-glucose 4-epimerase